MKELVETIRREGEFKPGNVVMVSGFLNHRMRTGLIDRMGQEFYRLFAETKPTLILTVEASGIGMACLAARYFDTDVLFAKKSSTSNINDSVYSAEVHSYTHNTQCNIRVDKRFLTKNDRVLIIDDFLANGQATLGLLSLCSQADAKVVGVGICVEKAFQPGGKLLRDMGVNLHSLAMVDLNDDGTISIREENENDFPKKN